MEITTDIQILELEGKYRRLSVWRIERIRPRDYASVIDRPKDARAKDRNKSKIQA